ncbi:MAG: Nif3-like dinuclear metal center hexameric protein, partial [Tuberibacillus sp.]
MTIPQYIDGVSLIKAFEAWAPPSLAEKWDKVGLQVGTLKKEIKKVMITLDVLENVVDEAAAEGVDLIFAHHPLIFHPLEKLLTDEGQSKIVAKCIQHNMTVYAAHTNLDVATGGMNDWLADSLQLQNP